VYLDELFGRHNFLNEIIWAYDYGGRGQRCWPKKHDNILVYVKNKNDYYFDWDSIPRVPYKAPELQYVGRTPEEAEKRISQGKVPTDVWDIPIIGTSSRERIGYPSQKPEALVKRVVLASCPPGGHVIDVFAGSGTTGAIAMQNSRNFTLVDASPHAIDTMRSRFQDAPIVWYL
jgi:site-specific DNA-methyltransferase (adenine-specific)